MLKKMLFPGKYIQGAGALCELPSLLAAFGQRGLILASTSGQAILAQPDYHHVCMPVRSFGGECCERELDALTTLVREQRVDVLVGMGGGKTIDTAKIAADRAHIPVVIVPTIASTDAPCSGCAVVYSEQGVFEAVHYQTANPAAVLVDTAIIARAPVRFLVAGMGDALATWFEARSCAASKAPNECGGLTSMTGLSLARLCYDTLLEYGVLAKIAAEQRVVTPALERIVEANILLSGIGFESGGLASAHSIHNGLTVLPETHAFFHGEKVAFGVLVGLVLTDAPPTEVETVYAFCEAVGLPTTLADIGLGQCSLQALSEVAAKACAPGEYIHHETGMINADAVVQAIVAANAVGVSRKAASAR